MTPLPLAAKNGHIEMMRFLLDRGERRRHLTPTAGEIGCERGNHRAALGDRWRHNRDSWGGVMDGAMIRLLTVVVLMGVAASAAVAECDDRPGPGIDWSGCTKARLLLGGRDLQNANLQRADLSGTDLREADLSGANMTEADLSRTRLAEAILKGADFTKAMLIRADLQGANLSSARLTKAELPRANLSNAILVDSNLEKAELGRAVLVHANLTRAILKRAYLARSDLRQAQLSNADLTDAELYLADLRGADLSQVLGLVEAQLEETCGDDTTKLPAGLAAPRSWPCASADEDD